MVGKRNIFSQIYVYKFQSFKAYNRNEIGLRGV